MSQWDKWRPLWFSIPIVYGIPPRYDMPDPKKPEPKEKTAAEEPSFSKYGVECGGPEKKVPAGTKEATEGCGACGGKHETE